MLLFIILLFLNPNNSWSIEPIDSIHELEQHYNEFIGSYQGFSENEIGSLFIKDGQLQFYYVSHGMVYRHFILPISLDSIKKRYRSMGIFFDYDEIIYDRLDNSISITRTYKTRFQKMVDVTKISLISGTQLEIIRNRKYFRKKNFFYGPWILDTESYLSKADSINLTYYYFKYSTTPTTFTYLSNFSETKNTIFVRAQNYSMDDSIRIEETTATEPRSNEIGQVIQINDFRLKHCNNYLNN